MHNFAKYSVEPKDGSTENVNKMVFVLKAIFTLAKFVIKTIYSFAHRHLRKKD